MHRANSPVEPLEPRTLLANLAPALGEPPGIVPPAVLAVPANAPVALFTVDRRTGPVPLAVAFDATASTDPNNQALLYSWNFGDGTSGEGPTVTHAYAEPGRYVARLTVTDPDGNFDRARLTILAGQTRPDVQILLPVEDTLFRAGERIAFSGFATDAEDGPIPEGRYVWRLIESTPQRNRLVQVIRGERSGSFRIPRFTSSDPDATYIVQLRVRDSTRLFGQDRVTLRPALSEVSVNATAPGVEIGVDGERVAAPGSVSLVAGSLVRITAPRRQVADGAVYEFVRWSGGSRRRSQDVVVPVGGTLELAIYRLVGSVGTFSDTRIAAT